MFERFTNHARHVIVLSQEEARQLGHNYIGTEHLLLGLLAEPAGLGAHALERSGMSLAGAREEVAARARKGSGQVSGHIPFTPRAKKVLELALREALELHHDYIGTEHLLLGMLREASGTGAKVIKEQASGGLLAVRMTVLNLLPAPAAAPVPKWPRRPASEDEPGEREQLRATPAADTSLDQAARLAGLEPVGSHHMLLAALGDPNSAAVRALAALGIDIAQARGALRGVDVTGTSDEVPEEAGLRQLVVRVAGDKFSIETADQTLVKLGRAALEALGGQAGQDGTIRGDLPASASLSGVWQALCESLEDIRRRAAAGAAAAGGPESPPDAQAAAS